MCYSLNQNKTIEKLNKSGKPIKAAATKKANSVPSAYYVNAFGFPLLPVITAESPNEIDIMRWGLVPSFIKDNQQAIDIRKNTINARSETVFEKVSFKNSILSQRCLVPANGFFEWRHEGDFKYPYYISKKDNELMYMAGIYSNWVNALGETEGTFSIITTEANSLMQKIHNTKKRMPVLFEAGQEQRWISSGLNENNIQQLMQPIHESRLQAHTIKRFSTVSTDFFSSSVIEPFEYHELAFFED